MNRITQFLHGTGTVSELMRHRREEPVPGRLLAFTEHRGPVVFWNMTRRCNLLCSHCYMEAGPGAPREDELTTEEAEGLIDDLVAARVPLLLLSGGEPLVREDFWDLARHARDRGLATALSTNGTLVTPEVARELLRAGVRYAGISLDGASPATHDRMRNVPGSFRLAVRGLESCVAAGLKCGVRVTVTPGNRAEIPALVDLALGLGVPRFCVYWLVPSGRGRTLDGRGRLGANEMRGILDHLHERARRTDPGVMEFLTVDAPQDALYLLSVLQREDAPAHASMCSLLERSGEGCSAGNRVANIDPAGDVYPCQFAQFKELRIGSVRERRFREIWNDPDNRVLALFRETGKRPGGRCGTCPHGDTCGGGCLVRAYAGTGDLRGGDPFCFLGAGDPSASEAP